MSDKPNEKASELVERVLDAALIDQAEIIDREIVVAAVAALEAKLSKMEENVRYMKRWASGINVHSNPQVVLDAMARMCEKALAGDDDE